LRVSESVSVSYAASYHNEAYTLTIVRVA